MHFPRASPQSSRSDYHWHLLQSRLLRENMLASWAWWLVPSTPALPKRGREGCKSEASLSYTVSSRLAWATDLRLCLNKESDKQANQQSNNNGPGARTSAFDLSLPAPGSLGNANSPLLPQCARLSPIISKNPAANAYTIRSELVSKKDFSNSCSSMFQLPSFIKVEKSETPAPNYYNVRSSDCSCPVPVLRG